MRTDLFRRLTRAAVCFCLLCTAATSQAQVFDPDQLIQATGNGLVQINATTYDANGNLFLGGGFTGTISIGGQSLTAGDADGNGTPEAMYPAADLFVAKFDTNGTLVWTARAVGASFDTDGLSIEGVLDLDTDAAGNVYVGGTFVKNLTFVGPMEAGCGFGGVLYPRQFDEDDTYTDYPASFEAFVARFNAEGVGGQGVCEWAIGGNGGPRRSSTDELLQVHGKDVVHAVAVNPQDGTLYVGGSMSGHSFLNTVLGDLAQTDNPTHAPVVAKLNPADGTVLWVLGSKIGPGTSSYSPVGAITGLAADGTATFDQDVLYAIGNIGGAVEAWYLTTNGFTTNPDLTLSTGSTINAFLLHLDPDDGDPLWKMELQSSTDHVFIPSDLAINFNQEVFVAGSFSGSYPSPSGNTLTATGSRDGYIAKIADDGLQGIVQWEQQIGGYGMAEAMALALDTDVYGNVYVAGSYRQPIYLGTGTARKLLDPGDDLHGLYVAMYANNGILAWAQNVHRSGGEAGTDLLAEASSALDALMARPVQLAFNPTGSRLRVTSTFSGTLTLADGLTPAATTYDAVSVRLDPPEVTVRDGINSVIEDTDAFLLDGINDLSFVRFVAADPLSLNSYDLTVTASPNVFPPTMPAGTKALRRFYHLIASDPATGNVVTGFNATLRLYYEQTEVDAAGLDEASLQLYRYDGTQWVLVGGTVNTTDNYVEVTGVSAFSDWAFADPGDAPLPVELTTFTAVASGNAITLWWETASETNNAGFEVQRATGPEERQAPWQPIGFVEGVGTTTEARQYQYLDGTAATSGTIRYRLRQLDLDGKSAYSPVIEVDLGPPAAFALAENYPNPFQHHTRIGFDLPRAASVELVVFDVLGREVVRLANGFYEAGQHEVTFDASLLPSGTYFYRLRTEGFVQARSMLLVR